MADRSGIEWTDATWNPIRARDVVTKKIGWHCTHVSEGCRNCYAENWNGRLGTGHDYKPAAHAEIEIFLDEKTLLAPLRWKKPRRIFVGSMTDLFADFVEDAWLDKIFAVMALCPQHTFQVLTKRPERAHAYITELLARHRQISCAAFQVLGHCETDRIFAAFTTDPTTTQWQPLPNVWLGTSAEDQKAADVRLPHLLRTPAAKRFVSGEPLLGQLDLRPWLSEEDGCEGCDDGGDGGQSHCCRSDTPRDQQCPQNFAEYEVTEGPHDVEGCPEWIAHKRVTLDWIIAGGESGPSARPMHPDWVRSLRDQCVAAGVPFFFKQWGEWAPHLDRDEDDPDWRQPYHKWGRDPRYLFLNLAGGCGFHGDRLFVMHHTGKKTAGAQLDGREWREMPA